jgi:hypothetical protein
MFNGLLRQSLERDIELVSTTTSWLVYEGAAITFLTDDCFKQMMKPLNNPRPGRREAVVFAILTFAILTNGTTASGLFSTTERQLDVILITFIRRSAKSAAEC